MKRWLPLLLVLPLWALAQNPSVSDEAIQAYKRGEYSVARDLFQDLLTQNPGDPTARNYLRMIAAKEQPSDATLEGSLEKVMIPKVDLHDVSARDAVTFVGQQVSKLTDGKQALNVVWLSPQEPAKVTLSLQNLPATEVLKYIADSANLQLAYETHALKIQAAAPQ